MGKSSNSGTQKTTSTNEPWSGVQPYLKGAYADAAKQYGKGAPGYYPGNLIAPMSGYTTGALDSMAQRAQAGSPVTRAAQGQLTDTLSGSYLDAGNPHFQGAVNAAIRPMVDNYTKTIMPGIDSTFAGAGRYGSGAHAGAAGDAANNLQTQIGDISSSMAYQNYGDERQNQIRGMLFAPEMAAQDYTDINALGQAGQGFDQYNQALIDADLQKYNFNSQKDFNFLSQYLGLLNNAQGGSQTTTSPVQRPNPFTSTLGGAATGFGIAGLPGALLGGGAGLLGSLF
jgi:hypothetical protein